MLKAFGLILVEVSNFVFIALIKVHSCLLETGKAKAAAKDTTKKAKNITDSKYLILLFASNKSIGYLGAKSAARSTRKATDNAYKGTKRAARKGEYTLCLHKR